MDKFSLYDILGILLPGMLFLFLLELLGVMGNISPLVLTLEFDWSLIGAQLCFGFIVGMFLYVLNFQLVQKKWFNRLTRMYNSVGDLYYQMDFLHSQLNVVLNSKAKSLYGKNIFLDNPEFDILSKESKEEIFNLQDKYYDFAYYELEYLDKIAIPKAFQSFYFFFRQITTGCLILISFAVFWTAISNIFNCYFFQISLKDGLYYISGVLILALVSIYLAKWNRKRMVLKLYYTYFSHLNSKIENLK